MTETNADSEPADLTDPGNFIWALVKHGFESREKDPEAFRWSEEMSRVTGKLLLYANDHYSPLPPDLTAAYPEALKNFLDTMPDWLTFSLFPEDIESLPTEAAAAIQKHIRPATL